MARTPAGLALLADLTPAADAAAKPLKEPNGTRCSSYERDKTSGSLVPRARRLSFSRRIVEPGARGVPRTTDMQLVTDSARLFVKGGAPTLEAWRAQAIGERFVGSWPKLLPYTPAYALVDDDEVMLIDPTAGDTRIVRWARTDRDHEQLVLAGVAGLFDDLTALRPRPRHLRPWSWFQKDGEAWRPIAEEALPRNTARECEVVVSALRQHASWLVRLRASSNAITDVAGANDGPADHAAVSEKTTAAGFTLQLELAGVTITASGPAPAEPEVDRSRCTGYDFTPRPPEMRKATVSPLPPPRPDDDASVLARIADAKSEWSLQDESTRARASRPIVLAALARSEWNLEFASDMLRADKELVLGAISGYGRVFRHAHPDLRADRAFALRVIGRNGQAFEAVDPALQNDKSFVIEAVRHEFVFGLTSETMRADRDVVLAALAANGIELRHAAAALRADRDVVLAAVRSNAFALEYAHASLRADRDVVRAAVESGGNALEFASKALQSDRRLVLAAVQSSGTALAHAHRRFRDDRDVVLAAVANDGDALEFASDRFRKSPDIVLAAVRAPHAFLWAGCRFFVDVGAARLVGTPFVAHVSTCHEGPDWNTAERLGELRTEVDQAFARDARALQNAHPTLLRDKKLAKQIVVENGEALALFSDEIAQDPALVGAADAERKKRAATAWQLETAR